uniref:Alternative protein DNAH2 n=1 Tax=Homo sapiens TaxID=9606 RepID=L8E8M4_HUMAN|nr:alternative protein DNAH2 [Homo sapiens]
MGNMTSAPMNGQMASCPVSCGRHVQMRNPTRSGSCSMAPWTHCGSRT